MLIKSFHRTLHSPAKHKIDRHLRDINDKITEEDISNVAVSSRVHNRYVINKGVIEINPATTDEQPVKKSRNPWNSIS